MTQLDIGKGRRIRSGTGVAILSFGSTLAAARVAAEELDATLVDMRFVKPLDETLVAEVALTHRLIVTIEENVIKGGAGSGVNEFLAASSIQVPVLNLGVPDSFILHDKPQNMLADCSLDAAGIKRSIASRLSDDSGRLETVGS